MRGNLLAGIGTLEGKHHATDLRRVQLEMLNVYQRVRRSVSERGVGEAGGSQPKVIHCIGRPVIARAGVANHRSNSRGGGPLSTKRRALTPVAM